MKMLILTLSVLSLLIRLPQPKLCAAPYAYPVIDELLQSKIKVPQATNPDDYLVELARNANVNFLADATDFPATAQLQPFPATNVAMFTPVDGPLADDAVRVPTLLNLILDFTQQQKLGHRRLDTKTFLFWSEPALESDLAQARKIVAGQGIQIPNRPTTLPQIQQLNTQTSALLGAYLQQAHDWHGELLVKPITVKFADLPEDLRRNLTTQTLTYLLNPVSGMEGWLTDEPWPKASLQIQHTIINAGPHHYTQVLSVVDDKMHFISVNVR